MTEPRMVNLPPPKDEDPRAVRKRPTLAGWLGWTSLVLSPLSWIATLRFGAHLLMGAFGGGNLAQAQQGLDSSTLLALLAGMGGLLGLASLGLASTSPEEDRQSLWHQPAIYALVIDALPAVAWITLFSKK